MSSNASYSHRSWETAVPLARRLHLSVVTKWGVGQERDLIAEATALTGVVLIFWEHKAIGAEIIPALLSGQSISGVPTHWDSERFDVVLRFDRAVPNAPWSFRQLSPCSTATATSPSKSANSSQDFGAARLPIRMRNEGATEVEVII